MLTLEVETDFKIIFESIPGLYLVLLPDFTIHSVNNSFAEATMTKRDNIVGKNIFEVFPDNPDDITADGVSNMRASLNFILKNKTAHTMPVQKYDILKPDGTFETKYWNIVNKPVLDSYNEVIYIIYRAKDVTDFVLQHKKQKKIDKKSEDGHADAFEIQVELYGRFKEILKQNELLEKKNEEAIAKLKSMKHDISDYEYALDESSIVSVTDKNGIIQHVNDNFCEISKYKREELMGQHHRIIDFGYHSKEFISNLWATIASGNIWKGELKTKAKDGTDYWVDTTIVPFLDEERMPYKYLSFNIDITQRKLNQIKLKNSEERYRNLYENAIASILYTDMKTLKVVEANQMCVELFGYDSREEFLEKFNPSNHYVTPNKRQMNLDILIEKGELFDSIEELRRKDGTHFWANLFLKLNSDRSLAQTVIIDITPQIEAYEKLKSSEEVYLDLFQNSLVAMFVSDPKTMRNTDANEMGLKIFGYKSKEDFLTNYDSSKHIVNSSDMEKMRNDIFATGEARNDKLLMKRNDGTLFWGKLFSKLNPSKNIIQTVLLDITRQINFQEELELRVKERTIELTESLSREHELNEMKSRFVSIASHEFKTPLSAILSSASLAKKYKEKEQEDKRLKHLERITSLAKNLGEILNDYLSLEQLDRGIIETEKKAFNLPEFFESLLDEMEGMTGKKNQRINYNHNGHNTIEQSQKILRNILLNLLSNASKYSPENKEIIVTSYVDENMVVISVKDEGIGIPEDDQKKLFTEFHRGANVEDIQGTGLGLSIVKKYIRLLDGNINFTSKLNDGTTFTIQIPQNIDRLN